TLEGHYTVTRSVPLTTPLGRPWSAGRDRRDGRFLPNIGQSMWTSHWWVKPPSPLTSSRPCVSCWKLPKWGIVLYSPASIQTRYCAWCRMRSPATVGVPRGPCHDLPAVLTRDHGSRACPGRVGLRR